MIGTEFVVYACVCGNYVAEPTVLNAAQEVPGRFRLSGSVLCTAAKHGALQPEMRRITTVAWNGQEDDR